MWRTMTKNARDLWNSHRLRIGYSRSTMTDDERMQRESSLIATIRKNLPDFAKACADGRHRHRRTCGRTEPEADGSEGDAGAGTHGHGRLERQRRLRDCVLNGTAGAHTLARQGIDPPRRVAAERRDVALVSGGESKPRRKRSTIPCFEQRQSQDGGTPSRHCRLIETVVILRKYGAIK